MQQAVQAISSFFAPLLESLTSTKRQRLHRAEVQMLVDATELRDASKLANFGFTLVRPNGMQGIVVFDLPDLPLGEKWFTERQTSVFRLSEKEVLLGQRIKMPIHTKQANYVLSGRFLPETLTLALKVIAKKDINEGLVVFEMDRKLGRVFTDLAELMPDTTYVSVDESIMLCKEAPDCIIFTLRKPMRRLANKLCERAAANAVLSSAGKAWTPRRAQRVGEHEHEPTDDCDSYNGAHIDDGTSLAPVSAGFQRPRFMRRTTTTTTTKRGRTIMGESDASERVPLLSEPMGHQPCETHVSTKHTGLPIQRLFESPSPLKRSRSRSGASQACTCGHACSHSKSDDGMMIQSMALQEDGSDEEDAWPSMTPTGPRTRRCVPQSLVHPTVTRFLAVLDDTATDASEREGDAFDYSWAPMSPIIRSASSVNVATPPAQAMDIAKTPEVAEEATRRAQGSQQQGERGSSPCDTNADTDPSDATTPKSGSTQTSTTASELTSVVTSPVEATAPLVATSAAAGAPPPPPPPPPPPMIGATPVREGKRMRTFHWKAIPAHKSRATFWGASSPTMPFNVDEDELEVLFSLSPMAAKTTTQKRQLKKQRSGLTLLDVKRANNAGIVLARFREEPEALRESVLHMDGNAFTVDQLRSLLSLYPLSPAEHTAVSTYGSRVSRLQKAEAFYVFMSSIPHVEQRLQSMLYFAQFDSLVRDLGTNMQWVRDACLQVKQSDRFAAVLKLVYHVGSFLNRGSYLGNNARGFALSTLLLLDQTKAKDSKFTLQHFLVNQMLKKQPHLVDFGDDFPAVETARRTSLSVIETELMTMTAGFNALKDELQWTRASEPKTATATAARANFIAKATPFVTMAEAKLTELRDTLDQVKTDFTSIAQYYGEDDMKSEDFFDVLNTFSRSVCDTRDRMEEAKARAQRRETKSIRLQRKRKARLELVRKRKESQSVAKSMAKKKVPGSPTVGSPMQQGENSPNFAATLHNGPASRTASPLRSPFKSLRRAH